MKRLVVTLLVLSFVLAGVSLAAADNLPKSLKGVDLKAAKQVSAKEAQDVRGTYQNRFNVNPNPGTCRDTLTTTCTPKSYLSPGPHRP